MPTPAYLTAQTITIPFRAGLDTKTAEKAVNPPSLVELENASFDAPGEIRKDPKYDVAEALNTVTGGTVDMPVHRTFGVGGRRMLFAKNDLYEIVDGTGTSSKLSSASGSGIYASTSAEQISEVNSIAFTNPYDGDYAYAGGYELLVASNFGASYRAIIRDRTTKTIAADFSLSMSGTAKAIACGTYLFLFWPESSLPNAIRFVRYDTSNPPTSIVLNTLVTDVSTQQCIDVATDGTNVYVAYHSSSGGGKICLLKLVASSLAQTSDVSTGNPSGGTIAVGVSTSNVLVAWCDSSNGVKVAGFTTVPAFANTSTENAAATSVNRMGVCDIDGTNCMLVYEDATSNLVINRVRCAANGSSVGTRRALSNFNLAHKPFVLNAQLYFGIMQSQGTTATSTENFYATVVANPNNNAAGDIAPIAWYLYTAAAARANKNSLPGVTLDGTEYRFMGSERVNVAKKDGSGVDYDQRLSLLSFRLFDGNAVPLYATAGFAGNAVRDRGGLLDISLHYAPTITNIAYANAGGGGLVAGQTYTWVAVYEFVDSYGQVQRSVPSVAVQGTVTGGNNYATLTVSTPFTRPGNRVAVVIYRTQAGLGAPHYRSAATANFVQRSSTPTTTVDDNQSDANIASRQQLYTDAGVLAAYPPPMGRHWAIHQNRIWVIDEHSGELRYTRTLVAGDAPAWHPNLTVPLATDRIDAKGLVSSPNGLWVLGQDKGTGAGAIAIIVGDGPADDGTGATYTVQRLEGNNAGITSSDAFVSIPGGIMFEDPKLGIHMLPSSGGLPQPVGLPVESLRAGKTLIRPTLLQDRHEVRFVYEDGFMLVYDYVVSQWFTRQLLGSESAYALMDTCVWDGQHVLADYAQGVFQQSSTAGMDAGASYVPTTITTGWIKLGDIEGLVRVWDLYLLGTLYDTCDLAVSVSYDYDDSSPDEYDYEDLADSGPLELRIPLRRQTFSAFKISVTDDVGTSAVIEDGTQEGYGLVGVRMRYGVFDRGNRLKRSAVAR